MTISRSHQQSIILDNINNYAHQIGITYIMDGQEAANQYYERVKNIIQANFELFSQFSVHQNNLETIEEDSMYLSSSDDDMKKASD